MAGIFGLWMFLGFDGSGFVGCLRQILATTKLWSRKKSGDTIFGGYEMATIPEKIHQSDKERVIDSTKEAPAMQCQSQQPIWKVVVEIGSQIPLEEWEKVPDDASINLKHYLYGEPKKNA